MNLIFKPIEIFHELFSAIKEPVFHDQEPHTTKHALQDPKWRQAMTSKYEAIKKKWNKGISPTMFKSECDRKQIDF